MKPILAVTFALVSAITSSWVFAAEGDPERGKAKSAPCAACHAADGNSANPIWPKIAGQHANYLAKQLSDFKAGDRQNDLMAGMVAGLSEQDMQDLAAFYAEQELKIGESKGQNLALGEQIYRSGNAETGVAACASCHGPKGLGNPPAGFPRISGQHAPYTVNTLKAFASGDRANDRAAMMRDLAARMTDKEMQAVADYLAGLK